MNLMHVDLIEFGLGVADGIRPGVKRFPHCNNTETECQIIANCKEISLLEANMQMETLGIQRSNLPFCN